MTGAQVEYLRTLDNVHLVPSTEMPVGEIKEAFQLKAHAACFLAARKDGRCIVQVDSDAILCAPLDGIVEQVVAQSLPAGGKDLNIKSYDLARYAPYYDLCQTTEKDLRATASANMSTSLLFLPVPEVNGLLELWSEGVDEAEFGPKHRARKIYAGYGDQGIFNSILYFKGITPIVLDNHLVSQHWVHGRDRIEVKSGEFWNNGRRQMAFHSVGDAPKFWKPQYVDFVAKSGNLDEVFRYWLSNLFDGPCGLLKAMPLSCLEQRVAEYFPGGVAAHLFREYSARNTRAEEDEPILSGQGDARGHREARDALAGSDRAIQAIIGNGNGATSAASAAAPPSSQPPSSS
ncbi:MAG: hypothetical protein P4L99_26050 [Chthoniobacter sp.]|nr:hypothetical protein [Chthoniobacter sp.]